VDPKVKDLNVRIGLIWFNISPLEGDCEYDDELLSFLNEAGSNGRTIVLEFQ
jgi:hypothetical protein